MVFENKYISTDFGTFFRNNIDLILSLNKPLSVEEQYDCIFGENHDYNKLFLSYIRLIYKIVKSIYDKYKFVIKNESLEIQDLFQQSYKYFIEAVSRIDKEKFSTNIAYIQKYVAMSLIKFINKEASQIKITYYYRNKSKKFEEAIDDIKAKGLPLTENNIKEYFKEINESYSSFDFCHGSILSLDELHELPYEDDSEDIIDKNEKLDKIFSVIKKFKNPKLTDSVCKFLNDEKMDNLDRYYLKKAIELIKKDLKLT